MAVGRVRQRARGWRRRRGEEAGSTRLVAGEIVSLCMLRPAPPRLAMAGLLSAGLRDGQGQSRAGVSSAGDLCSSASRG